MDVIETETASESPASTSRRRLLPWVIGLGLIVVIAAGGLFWFFSGDAPAEVDLTETASAVTESSVTETSATGAASGVVTTDGIEGIWSVDTSVGEFTVTEETTATFAGFRVEEVLESIGSATAVGRTPVVSGSIEIEGTTLTSAEVVVDLTSIVSDQARRENAIQRALGTGANPEATFVLTEPIDLGEEAASGELVDMVATGELTVNGVTNTVQIPLQTQLFDGMILVTGSTEILFADYGVTAPSAPVVVSVEDNGILEFQLWLAR
jgi:polyisoprenoid-binding protein YceI